MVVVGQWLEFNCSSVTNNFSWILFNELYSYRLFCCFAKGLCLARVRLGVQSHFMMDTQHIHQHASAISHLLPKALLLYTTILPTCLPLSVTLGKQAFLLSLSVLHFCIVYLHLFPIITKKTNRKKK